jgi:Kdo2-lipid IVA lauroyltransferase/acyltransferase
MSTLHLADARRALGGLAEFAVGLVGALFLLPIWFLPWNAAVRLGRVYGWVVGLAQPTARRAAMINIRRAYGPLVTRPSARRAAHRVFANMGQSLAEGIQYARRVEPDGQVAAIHWEAEDRLLEDRVLMDSRPKIFLTGHFGSWELATILAGLRQGGRGAVVARRVDNRLIDLLLRRLRFPRQFDVIEKRGASRAALERLRAGESVAMLFDENAGWQGVFVPFFGRPASTTRLPALLALMTDSPIVLGAAVRKDGTANGDTRFVFRLALFEPAGYAQQGAAGVHALTQAIVERYEQWVRDDPWQWRWIHWRWKTRPEGREETYTRRDVDACFQETSIS